MKVIKSFAVSAIVPLALAAGVEAVLAEEFVLEPIHVVNSEQHDSQAVRAQVERAFNSSRSVSHINGSVIQNLNPVNKGDGLRYHATGLMNQPGNGDRFGGGSKIRTFGDWGAAESIDGLPAFKSAGQEGGGVSNTMIPSIALESIEVKKGGRAVQYGDGTDGGVLQTNIKSGRAYQDHQALSMDSSSARELQLQAEMADSNKQWDYYVAGKGFRGNYNGDPSNLDQQSILGGVSKLGWNPGANTRAEFLAIYDSSKPTIIRNGEINEIETNASVAAVTVDHRLSEQRSLEFGALTNHSRSVWDARSRDRSIDNHILFINHFLSSAVSEAWAYNGSVGAQYKQTNAKRDKQWDNTFDDYALISRNAFTLRNNLTLSGGFRYTWFNNDIVYDGLTQADNLADDGLFSYQLGASYNPIKQTRLRASVATGFNRFFEKYGNFGTDVLTATGAGDEVVDSRTLEVGLNHQLPWGFVDLAAYAIVQDNVPRRNAGELESVEVEQSGFEVEVFHAISERLSLSVGYTGVLDLEATRADGSEVNGNIFWDGQATSVPKNQFNARTNYHLSDTLQVWGAGYYSTGYEAVDAEGVITERKAFARFDIGANWQAATDWHLRIRAENLLDEKDFGQSIKGAPSSDEGKLGRVLWLGADYTF